MVPATDKHYTAAIGVLQRAGWQKGSMFEEVYFIPGKEAAAEWGLNSPRDFVDQARFEQSV